MMRCLGGPGHGNRIIYLIPPAEGLVSEEGVLQGWGAGRSAGAWVGRADYTCSRKLCCLGPKPWDQETSNTLAGPLPCGCPTHTKAGVGG